MRICSGRPPNYAEIADAFGPLSDSTIFAYGDTIYAPRPDELPGDLIAHEKVHLRQQREVGGPENRVASDLASSMYGSLIDRHEAWKLITA